MSKNGLFVEYCAKDFLDGVLLLDPWEELAYRRICDMIYVTNNNLCDDDKKLAWATKTGNRWLKIKAALIQAEKIFVIDGMIINEKCTKTLAKSAKNILQKSEAGTASADARKALKDNETAATDVDQAVATTEPTAVSTNQEPKNPSLKGIAPISPDLLMEAFEAWNAIARECDLPKIERHTEQRKKLLRVRLGECDGVEGWVAALELVRSSPFLRGDNDRGWVADFDFIVQSKNFTKLVEGRYQPKIRAAPAIQSHSSADSSTALLRAKIESFRKTGRWDSANDGPAPGEPSCKVPPHLLIEAAASSAA